MKFIINYVRGNGYHCHCCRSSYDKRETVDSYEEAVKLVAGLKAEKENGEDVRYESITPVPESPGDFILEDTYWVPNFNESDFDVATAKLSKEMVDKSIKEKAEEEQRMAIQAAEDLVRREKAELERLSAKYSKET